MMRKPRCLATATHFLALLLSGVLAGATFGIWQGYDPRGLDAAAFMAMHQEAVRGLNVVLPVFGIGSVALMGIAAWLARKDRATLRLFLVALVCMAAGGVITRVFNQTINAEVMQWSAADLPDNWAELRSSWWDWHVARTCLALAGFGVAIIAVLRRQSGVE